MGTSLNRGMLSRVFVGVGGVVSLACGSVPEGGAPPEATPQAVAEVTPAASHDSVSGHDEAWLETVRTRIEAGAYRFFRRDYGFFAQNDGEGLRAEFGEQGARLSERATPDQQLTLRFTAWGRAGNTAAVGEPTFRLGACAEPSQLDAEGQCVQQLEAEHGGIREWWNNRPTGLEQGWTIAERPAGTGRVELVLSVEGARLQGSSGVVWLTQPNGSSLGYENLHVTDAQGQALDASLLVSGEQIIIAFDDANAVYPVLVDPIVSSAAFNVQDEPGNLFGHSVNGAGDINGDGFDDVIIGAAGYDTLVEDGGRAFVYYGSGSGMSSTAAWFTDGTWPGGYYGYAVATAGDINADGYADVLVGEPVSSALAWHAGGAYIYLGSSTGLATTAVWNANGGYELGWFGYAVASAGDTNGDGMSDILIGAPNTTNGHDREGRAYLFSTKTGSLDTIADWTREPQEAVAFFGSSLAGVGDVNGDGRGDVLVGAYYYGPTDEGMVWGYLGQSSGSLGNSAWSLRGTQAGNPMGNGEQLGTVVAPAGDMNGDGYADVLIAAPGWDTADSVNAGHVMVHYSSASGFDASRKELSVGADGSWTGHSTSAVGDANGDGYADVAVASSNASSKVYFGGNITGFVDRPEASHLASAGDLNGDGRAEMLLSHRETALVESADRPQEVQLGPSVDLSDMVPLAGFGRGVAICDADNDGYSDLIAGTPVFDDGQPRAGKVSLYAGSSSGLSSNVSYSATGGVVDGTFGTSIACADFNGDGYADLAVGSSGYSNGQTNEGRVSIIHGQSGWFAATPARLLESNKAISRFSESMATGDVNGDGFMDLAISASNDTNDQTNEGRVFVYYGSATGIGASPSRTLEGSVANAGFGRELAMADINRDGYDDLVVGSPTYTNGQTDEGRVYAYFGASTGLPATSAWGAEPERSLANFGGALALGDANGDGYVDLLVGAPNYSNPEASEGRIFFYPASSTGLASATWFFEGNLAQGILGNDLAAGDWNNDGYADFAVGFPGYKNSKGAKVGAVRLFTGSSSFLPASPQPYAGGRTNQNYPESLFLSGDFNGDGLSDVAVNFNDAAKAGHVAVGSLPRGGGALTLLRPGTGVGLQPGNKSPSRAIDVRMFARSPFGRTRAKVQVEVKPRGTAFNGQGLFTSSTWVDTGVNGASVTASVTGLAANTAYHVRARLRWDPSRGMAGSNSRWYYAGTPGQTDSVHVRTP